MSTKNIALNTKVYEKLARFKDESESFSKAVDRLLDHVESEKTGADILKQLHTVCPLVDRESRSMKQTVNQNRKSETWDPIDLS